MEFLPADGNRAALGPDDLAHHCLKVPACMVGEWDPRTKRRSFTRGISSALGLVESPALAMGSQERGCNDGGLWVQAAALHGTGEDVTQNLLHVHEWLWVQSGECYTPLRQAVNNPQHRRLLWMSL